MYDKAETERRGYSGKSKVRFDGTEILVGKDWTKRKQELWNRAGGRCEKRVFRAHGLEHFERCRSEGHHPHHIIHRSKQRNDDLKNLVLLCSLHHSLEHKARNPRWGEASQLRSKRLLGVA